MRSRGVVSALATAAVLFGASAAWASPGCVALNGTLGPNFVITGNQFGTGFDAGDVITITATVMSNGEGVQLADVDAGPMSIGPLLQDDPGSVSYTVPANTTHQFGIGYSLGFTAQVSWSCVSANGQYSGTPSQKLAALQANLTPIVAITSAQAITGAIDGAINDAFSPAGVPFRGGSNGFTVNFSAEPPSKLAQGTDNAFGALAYAGNGRMAAKAPRATAFERDWSLWADVRGTGWRDNSASNGFDGRQLNVTAGIGRKLAPGWLIGLVGGYESFNYEVAALTGTLKGHGGTVGGYAAWKITPTLRWDTALTWSHVNYDASVTGAGGAFSGSRWIASTGLTGQYHWLAFILEPSAKVFGLWERQAAWTDSVGTLQAERDFSAGRVSAGGRIVYPWSEGSLSVSPYLGLFADHRFGSNTLSSGMPVIGIENGWSGRLTGGVSIAAQSGGALTLGGEVGGLGADHKMWSGQARLHWPF